MSDQQAGYDEVYVYSMGRPGFLLQHVADAFAVQSATAESKPISLVFGLAGLYLYVEKNFSGRQVQNAHRELARRKREWPRVILPEDRGVMTVRDVLAAPAGEARDRAIQEWCRSLWLSFAANRGIIETLLRDHRIL